VEMRGAIWKRSGDLVDVKVSAVVCVGKCVDEIEKVPCEKGGCMGEVAT
jgi:hypothetical protein